MLLHIPDVLTAEQVAHARQTARQRRLGRRPGHRRPSVGAREGQPAAARGSSGRRASSASMILGALQRNPLFISAALPLRVFPPLFNRYQGGQSFGTHVDNAIRQVPGTPHRIRTDLSATLFLSRPGRVRRRRAGRRGHLRRAQREAAGRPPGALSVDQPAPRAAGDARRARLLVLLDPEHGARRRRAHAAVRSRHGDPAAAGNRRGRTSVGRAAHRRVSQPAARWAELSGGSDARPQRSFSRIELPTRSKAGP